MSRAALKQDCAVITLVMGVTMLGTTGVIGQELPADAPERAWAGCYAVSPDRPLPDLSDRHNPQRFSLPDTVRLFPHVRSPILIMEGARTFLRVLPALFPSIHPRNLWWKGGERLHVIWDEIMSRDGREPVQVALNLRPEAEGFRGTALRTADGIADSTAVTLAPVECPPDEYWRQVREEIGRLWRGQWDTVSVAGAVAEQVGVRQSIVEQAAARLRSQNGQLADFRLHALAAIPGRDEYVLVGWGAAASAGTPMNLGNELFGVFVADAPLRNILTTLGFVESRRWRDYRVTIDLVTASSVRLLGRGEMYGDAEGEWTFAIPR